MANLVLKSVGDDKIKVIEAVCEVTKLGLEEAKDIVERVDAGDEYMITGIQKAEMPAIIQKFAQIGTVVIADEEESQEDSGDTDKEQEPNKVEKALDLIFEWHKKCLERNKVLTIILIIAEVVFVLGFVLWLLFKTWAVIFSILIIASIVLPFIMKKSFTDQDRKNSKEVLGGIAKFMVVAVIIVVIALNWNSISSIFRPGAVVRDSYFINYSDEITIGEAFENVFTDFKWSKYTYNGNEYVRFTGKFKGDDGKVNTYQFNFLVLGDSATIDSIYIDGVDVSGMETIILLSIYERNGISW